MLEYSAKVIVFCGEAETEEWAGLKSGRADWGGLDSLLR